MAAYTNRDRMLNPTAKPVANHMECVNFTGSVNILCCSDRLGDAFSTDGGREADGCNRIDCDSRCNDAYFADEAELSEAMASGPRDVPNDEVSIGEAHATDSTIDRWPKAPAQRIAQTNAFRRITVHFSPGLYRNIRETQSKSRGAESFCEESAR